jgi:phage terminase small subunit
MTSERSNLTSKHERFVQEYLVAVNAPQAAIRAGYSKKTAQEQSSRL